MFYFLSSFTNNTLYAFISAPGIHQAVNALLLPVHRGEPTIAMFHIDQTT